MKRHHTRNQHAKRHASTDLNHSAGVEGERAVQLTAPSYGVARADEGLPLQAKAIAAIRPPSVNLSPSGTGSRLPERVQNKMERSFGVDFSGVRVHQGPQALSIGAKAFTRGKDIHISPSYYSPDSHTGQELIGHELAHVVQQAQGRVPRIQARGATIVNSNPTFEHEADVQGAMAARGERVFGGSTVRTALSSTAGFGARHSESVQRNALEGAAETEAPLGSPLILGPIGDDVIQPAYIAHRGVRTFLGNLNINPLSVYHQHIFFEDGGAPPNIGYGPNGTFTDDLINQYDVNKDSQGYDDQTMRTAVANVVATGNFTGNAYRVVGHNCQTFVSSVLAEYMQLTSPNGQPASPNGQPASPNGQNDRQCTLNGCISM